MAEKKQIQTALVFYKESLSNQSWQVEGLGLNTLEETEANTNHSDAPKPR